MGNDGPTKTMHGRVNDTSSPEKLNSWKPGPGQYDSKYDSAIKKAPSFGFGSEMKNFD